MRHAKQNNTIHDISKSIEEIICDDELLAKITINFLSQLNQNLYSKNLSNNISSSKIIETCWPYSQNPLEEKELSISPMIYCEKELKKDLSNEFEAKIYTILQKSFGKKVTVANLLDVALTSSKVISIPLRRKSTHSKQRIIQWLYQNWEKIQPRIDEIISLSCDSKQKE